MRLNDIKEDSEPARKENTPIKKNSSNKKELEEAKDALHKASLALDILLRNIVDKG